MKLNRLQVTSTSCWIPTSDWLRLTMRRTRSFYPSKGSRNSEPASIGNDRKLLNGGWSFTDGESKNELAIRVEWYRKGLLAKIFFRYRDISFLGNAPAELLRQRSCISNFLWRHGRFNKRSIGCSASIPSGFCDDKPSICHF
jgi:hypothetical protein